MSTATFIASRGPAPVYATARIASGTRPVRRDMRYAGPVARPVAAPPIPGLRRKLIGAVLGVAGIAAAALQTAGYLPRPGEWFTLALAEADAGLEVVVEREIPAPAVSLAVAPAPAPVEQVASGPVLSAPVLKDVGGFRAAGSLANGGLANGPSWAFEPSVGFAPFTVAEAAPDLAPDVPEEPHAGIRLVPLPKANPLAGLLPEEEALPPVVVRPPVPSRSPLMRVERQMASLPADEPVTREEKAVPPPRGSAVTLPGPTDRYAVYDITASTVYMPNGERLEAHSGYGSMFDDPRHVSKRMRGPTPPNVYNLKMREALFHGVEAIRMNPVDPGKMYGRDGILAHTYMLGSRGDSNGCVSFRDYDRFLAAFKRGEVKQMIVVAKLDPQPSSNPLLSWLMPR